MQFHTYIKDSQGLNIFETLRMLEEKKITLNMYKNPMLIQWKLKRAYRHVFFS